MVYKGLTINLRPKTLYQPCTIGEDG